MLKSYLSDIGNTTGTVGQDHLGIQGHISTSSELDIVLRWKKKGRSTVYRKQRGSRIQLIDINKKTEPLSESLNFPKGVQV